MFKLFRPKPDLASAARLMAQASAERRRAKIRAKVDEMRAQMGLEPARWP